MTNTWRAAQHPFGQFIVSAEVGNDIALIVSPGGKAVEKENANLIAAAPKLLEALEKLLHWESYAYPACQPDYDGARAAIASARGKK